MTEDVKLDGSMTDASKEREAIVAWLRDEAGRIGTSSKLASVMAYLPLLALATAIENGSHIKGERVDG